MPETSILSSLSGCDRCCDITLSVTWRHHKSSRLVGLLRPNTAAVSPRSVIRLEQLQADSDRKQEERIQPWPSTGVSSHRVSSDLAAPLRSATVRDENVERWFERVAVVRVAPAETFFRTRVVKKWTTKQSKRWNKRVNERQRRHRSLPHQQPRYVTAAWVLKKVRKLRSSREERRIQQSGEESKKTRMDGQTKQLIGSWTSL